MTRPNPRQLLERDRLDPTCAVCGGPADGAPLCTGCELAIVDELEREGAEWWPEPEFEDQYSHTAAWEDDDDWDDDDLPF